MSTQDTADTAEDWYGTEAPEELNGVDLIEADDCPACGETAQYEQQPAGYYHCTSCRTIWAGDRSNAELVDYSHHARSAATGESDHGERQ